MNQSEHYRAPRRDRTTPSSLSKRPKSKGSASKGSSKESVSNRSHANSSNALRHPSPASRGPATEHNAKSSQGHTSHAIEREIQAITHYLRHDSSLLELVSIEVYQSLIERYGGRIRPGNDQRHDSNYPEELGAGTV